MAFSTAMQDILKADYLPDRAQLDWRQVVTNGVGENLVRDGLDADDRALGVQPQWELSATQAAGTTLAASTTYAYGIQRILTLGALQIPSSMTLATVIVAGATRDATITIVDYPYTPGGSANWTISYRVYRSKEASAQTLYLVAELTQAQVTALSDGEYLDQTIDDNLDTDYVYYTTVADVNGWIPPCRFVRAWRGRFVLAGALNRAVGDVVVEAGTLTTVTCPEAWTVRASDVGATLRIAAEPWLHVISAADVSGGVYTIATACAAAHTGSAAAIFRPDTRVYVSNPYPANIESYTVGTEIARNDGAGESLTGLAVHGGYAYLFHTRGLILLDLSAGGVSVVPYPGGVSACVSHATIADGKDCPALYYYAGKAGVIEMQGSGHRNIGVSLARVLRDRVDHSLDQFTHAVYDPERHWYMLWLFEQDDVENLAVRCPRLCLVWDVENARWYEFSLAAVSSALWDSPSGGVQVVLGLPGNGVGVLTDDESDGSTLSGTVATADTIGATTFAPSGADFPTAPSLAGVPCDFITAAGYRHRRLIASNTSSTLTLTSDLPEDLVVGWTWVLGAIPWSITTGGVYPDITEKARAERVLILHEKQASAAAIDVTLYPARRNGTSSAIEADLSDDTEVVVAANRLEVRSRGFSLKVEGTEPCEIGQVVIETEGTNRHG
jgi:hypothetical protein